MYSVSVKCEGSEVLAGRYFIVAVSAASSFVLHQRTQGRMLLAMSCLLPLNWNLEIGSLDLHPCT